MKNWWQISKLLSIGLLIWLGLGSPLAAQPATQCVATALAGGTGDDITLPKLPCSLTTTLLVLTLTATNTTTSPTMQMVGAAALPVVRADGSAVAPGELAAGLTTVVEQTGTRWKVLLNSRTNLLASSTTALYYAREYGTCTWDASHDVGACINSASAAASGTGGTVVVPGGNFGQTTKLLLPGNVCVVGAGSASNGTGGAVATGTATGTKLLWLGAAGGRMAESISTTGQVMQSCVNKIAFDGNNGLAADGLHAASVFRYNFDDLSFIGGFNGGKIVYIGSDAAAGGGSQNGSFDRLYIDNGGGGWTSDQLELAAFINGTGVHGNASFTTHGNDIFISGDGATTGFRCRGCDNTFLTGRIFNTNNSVDYTIAQSGVNLFPANGNRFEGQYSGPAYFRGQASFATCVSYSTCTYNNEIIIDQTNGTPQPTVEAVGNHWKSNSGYAYGYSFIGKNGVQPALWAAHDYSLWGACELAAKANDSSGVAYFCNSTSGGLVSFDSIVGDRFRISFTGSAGAKNVLLSRQAGTGLFEFSEPLQLDQGTTGKGTHATAAFNTTTFGQFLAESEDYGSTSTSTALLQYGSAAAGTTVGLSNAHLGLLGFLNTTGGLIYTNNAVPLVFGTNGIERARIENDGVLTVNTSNTVPVRINAVTAGNSALFSLLDADTLKWQWGKQTDNSFALYDVVNSLQALTVSTAGIATLGETGKSVNLVGGTLLSNIASDATHTDSTVCQDTTTHQLYAGSGAAGICLGTSSLRFKRDVGELEEGLASVLALKPIHYRYKEGLGFASERELFGFAAEQVAQVVPKLAGLDSAGMPSSVDWAGIVPMLVKAVQEQQSEIEALRQGQSR